MVRKAVVFSVVFFSCACAYAQQAAGDYEKLKKEYETLKADYENSMEQSKVLKQYKNKARDMEDDIRQFDLVREQLMKEKGEALNQVAELKERIKSQDETIVKLGGEKDEYKKSFEKATVENIIGEESKKKIEERKQETQELVKRAEDLQARIQLMDNSLLKEQAQAEFYRRQLSEVKDKYEEARKQNAALERKLEDMPKKFTELARENKVLIKRTSAMHYNLGVFYTQNKEFERAVAEFEKAVELNPDDSASHFNLGYIYAEHLLNRPRAVTHFKQFLKLAKKDDKDVDWARRYILTWQTWEGNVPIK